MLLNSLYHFFVNCVGKDVLNEYTFCINSIDFLRLEVN